MGFRASHIKNEFMARQRETIAGVTRKAIVTINRFNKLYDLKLLTNLGATRFKSKYDHLNDYANVVEEIGWNSWQSFVRIQVKTEDTEESDEETNDEETTDDSDGEPIEEITYPDHFLIEWEYTAPENGYYSIETVYSGITDCELSNRYYIDGVEEPVQEKWTAHPELLNRNVTRKFLKAGTHVMTLFADENTVWLGAIIRKVETYTADTENEGDLTLIDFDLQLSEGLNVNELEVNLFYENMFAVTKSNGANLNGDRLLLDYGDEITVQVEDDTKVLRTIFGGYISTVNVNDDGMQVTLKCADRLIDCEKRTNFVEITYKKGEETENYDEKSKKNFDSYGKVLNYLTESVEIPIKNNIPPDRDNLDGESFKQAFQFMYGSQEGSITEKCTGNGIDIAEDSSSASTKTPYMQLRNNPDKETDESVELFNSAWFPQNDEQGLDITNYPTMWVTYGLGDPKEEYQVCTAGSSGDYSNLTGDFVNKAKELTKGITGTREKAEAIFNYVKATLSYSSYRCRDGRSIDQILSDGWANCYDSAYVYTSMCRAAGLNAGYYTGTHTFPDETAGHGWSYVMGNSGEIIVDCGRSAKCFDCTSTTSEDYSGNRVDELDC